jgi:hypothetical protein
MIESSFEREFTAIAKEYEKSGGNVSDFLRKDIVSIIVSGNKVIGRNTVEGVRVRAKNWITEWKSGSILKMTLLSKTLFTYAQVI